MSPATAEECLKRQSVVYAGAQKASIFLCVSSWSTFIDAWCAMCSCFKRPFVAAWMMS